ncbi:AIR synthase-related protein [Dactylosporangium sp. NPDC050688]|uniref:AIR synthase-related protein n=1 Tax=Dactylosporangium sp. NPDC050688 TaxID=3157217 RepID=UPI003406D867
METIRDLGEKGFIRKLLSRYALTARIEALDDCVILDPARLFGNAALPYVVYSMDHPSPIDRPLPEGMWWRYWGRWIAACTANDVLAMGGKPEGFSLDLAMPADTATQHIGELYQGLGDVLHEYGAALEGGNIDINAQRGVVGMCWGTVPRAGAIRRQGARCGDHIAVTTALGVGWASYVLRKRDLFDSLDPATRTELEQYNLMPLAPHRAIVEASHRRPGAITSGMDMSDGLVEFLYTINESSGLGARVDEERLPVTSALAESAKLLDVPPSLLAFEFGFDMPRSHGYTVAPGEWDAVAAIFESHGTPLYRIGEVTADPAVVFNRVSGPPQALPPFWDDKCNRDDVIERWDALVEQYRN